MILREYQQVRGTTRLIVQQMLLGYSHLVLVTVRTPNPAYERIHWLDKDSTEPSHLQEQTVIPCTGGWESEQEYSRVVQLIRFMGNEIPAFVPQPAESKPKRERKPKERRWDQ